MTTAFRYLFVSIINSAITGIFSLPFLFIYGAELEWKLTWVSIFLLYTLVTELVFNRCLGMVVLRRHYQKSRSVVQKIIYSVLYTASFSTLLFYLWFPFDLLLINLLLVQLPTVLVTGNTLHGFLSESIKNTTEHEQLSQRQE